MATSGHKILLMLGYIAEERRDSVNLTSFLRENGDHAFYLPGTFQTYPDGKTFDAKWNGKNCKVSDRMELRFDFESRCCDLYYNAEKVGLITDKLPNSLYPAISFHSNAKPQFVETTKFYSIRKRETII